MFNVCLECGRISSKVNVEFMKSSYSIICSYCNNRVEFRRTKLFIVLGASGIGKSTISQKLVGTIKNCIVIDTDVFWREEFNTPESEFIEYKEYCMKIGNSIGQNGYSVFFFMQGIPDEFENYPFRKYYSEVNYLLLTANIETLKDRLDNKPEGWSILDSDPNQMNRILKYNDYLSNIKPNNQIRLLDTTDLDITETIYEIRN